MTLLESPTLRERSADVGASLGSYRHGAGDPTTWMTRFGRGDASAGRFVRASHTPDGPATLSLTWQRGRVVDAEAYGPGAPWMLARVPAITGSLDPGAPELERDGHPAVARAAARHRHLRLGASGDLYHELLPTVIEQRITIGEAHRQWKSLCFELGEPAPGPFARLLLPPAPDVLSRRPSWWFHPLGVERKRAHPLITVARHASKLWRWASLTPSEAAAKLQLLPGIGRWTVGSVCGPALGDADAVAVGDFHLKNVIACALAGEARATDERMLELLEPYRGQRGRVVRLLLADGASAPKFGPKQRVLPMHSW